METRRGRIKLVENLEGEITYEIKVREILKEYPDEHDEYSDEFWRDALSEACYDHPKLPQYVVLGDNLYEILEDVNLEGHGFCDLTENPDGSISYLANWYNSGAHIGEVLENALRSKQS